MTDPTPIASAARAADLERRLAERARHDEWQNRIRDALLDRARLVAAAVLGSPWAEQITWTISENPGIAVGTHPGLPFPLHLYGIHDQTLTATISTRGGMVGVSQQWRISDLADLAAPLAHHQQKEAPQP